MRNVSIEHNPLWTDTEIQRYPVLVSEFAVCRSEEVLYKIQMQNEELRRTHVALEESRDRYAALYKFDPVGYLTLTHNGLIAKINPTTVGLLGLHRKKLLHHYFDAFVAEEDGDRWQLFFSDVMKHSERKNIGLRLKRNDGAVFSVQMDCLRVMTGNREQVLNITLTDILGSKVAETVMREVEKPALLERQTGSDMGVWNRDFTTGQVIHKERWRNAIEPHVDTLEMACTPVAFPSITLR